MRLTVNRYCINIYPESEVDEAYLEEVLGASVRQENAAPPVVQVNKEIGLTRIASLQIKRA